VNTGSAIGDPASPEREQVVDVPSPQVGRGTAGETTPPADATTGGRRRWWGWTRECPEPPRELPIVTFSDLVRAHRAWEHELYEHERHGGQPDRVLEDEFHEKWRLFEERYGPIDTAYWSVRDASAVALTIEERPRRWWPGREPIPRFHRATDWATKDEPEVARALDNSETLAVKVEEILRGPSELIALRRINAVASHVLGFVDRAWGRRPPPATTPRTSDTTHEAQSRDFVARQEAELEQIELFYRSVGEGQARILFFWGMVEGLLVLVVITALAMMAALGLDHLGGGPSHWRVLHLFVVSVIAGALGAVLSVLTRMSSLTGKFVVDHELGRKNVRWLGIYRPFVGGIFGLATFLTIESGVLQTRGPTRAQEFAYYGIFAFFSGFFERFTKVLTPGTASDGGGRKDDGSES
jgi:hypothetical protein